MNFLSGYRKHTMRRQFLSVFVGLILFSILTVTIILSRSYFIKMKDYSLEHFSSVNKQITSNINDSLGTINNYYDYILSNRIIFRGLQESSFGSNPDTYDSVVVLKDLFYSFINIHNSLEAAFYISREGVVISSLSGSVSSYIISSGDFLEQPFILDLADKPRAEIWYKGDLDSQEIIYYIKGIRDPKQGHFLGFLCFVIDEEYFSSQIKDLAGINTHFYICDEQGNPFLSSRHASDFNIGDNIKQKILTNSDGSIWISDDKYYLSEQTANSWYIVSELAVSDLMDLRSILLLGCLAFFITAVPTILLSRLFASKYTKDLESIVEVMKGAEQNTLEELTHLGKNIEIQSLASTYNDMIRRIKRLNEDLRQEVENTKRAEKERVLLETQLRQSQKMEALGQLAGGVAHDFNNLLTGIYGFVDLSRLSAEEILPSDNELFNHLDEIETTAQRAATLTRQLLTFSRKDVISPKKLDLNQVIQGMVSMLQRLVQDNISLDILPGKKLALIIADPGHMEQVLMNLVINAVQAMPKGGRLVIETSNVIIDKDYLNRHSEAASGPHVLLSVCDTGHGMDQAILEKVFEPFFTTKFRDKGTGLGLATVHGIVKQSKGHISVSSEKDKGTTFKLYFPALDGGQDA